MMLRRFAFWITLGLAVLAFAGFVGTVQLQRAINATRDRQSMECAAVVQIEHAVRRILRAEVADPSTGDELAQTIRRQEPIFRRALEASHHCD